MSEFHRGAGRVADLATNAAIPTSGALRFGQFYGTGNTVTAAASSGTNVDVAPLFPGTFTNTDAKILTIAAPIQITGNNVALTVPSNMGGTLDIQNAGNIIGSRGNGGNGGTSGNGGDASVGGAAISIQSNGITLNNSGTVSGGGGGGGGGAKGAPVSSNSQVNFGAANYGNSNIWYQRWNGQTFLNNVGKKVTPVGTFNFSGGGSGTTVLNTGSGANAAQINRGSSLGDQVFASPHNKRYNLAGGFYTTSSTTPGGNGGGGGNGYGWNGSNIVNPESGSAGSSPGGAAGGAGGGAGAAGTAGSNSPAFSGGSAGAGGNSLTSPGSVNYSITNSGTINGTQG
tara:strand:- start:957 stop:1982 length:1026 start_codon:yes stop_codon:yes gene_type:complete